MNALEKLREGYARDLIDLETFERFVGLILEGRMVALPVEVASLGSSGPASASTFSAVLKAGWTEDRLPKGHDWQDGKGPVHSISLAQHHEIECKAWRTLRDRAAAKHGLL